MSSKYYEKELAEYKDKFYDCEFVPFPGIYETIEAITETAGSVIGGDQYLLDVLAALEKEIDERNEEMEAHLEMVQCEHLTLHHSGKAGVGGERVCGKPATAILDAGTRQEGGLCAKHAQEAHPLRITPKGETNEA